MEDALIENHYVHEKRFDDGSVEKKPIAVYICLGDREKVLGDPFCGDLLEGINLELKKHERSLIYGTVKTNDDFENALKSSYPEGAILLGCEPDSCEALSKRVKKPVVFIDSGEGDYDNIGISDVNGAREITTFLIRQGHEKIAFFCDQKPPLASNLERWHGFLEAMKANDLTVSEEDFFYLPSGKNLRHEVLRQFAKKAKKLGYTAAFFVSDLLANEATGIFNSNRLLVPDDLSVAGYDDNIYARLCVPALTTIRQSPEEKGREAVRLLMKRIHGEEVPVRSITLPTELIVRDSVRNISGI